MTRERRGTTSDRANTEEGLRDVHNFHNIFCFIVVGGEGKERREKREGGKKEREPVPSSNFFIVSLRVPVTSSVSLTKKLYISRGEREGEKKVRKRKMMRDFACMFFVNSSFSFFLSHL